MFVHHYDGGAVHSSFEKEQTSGKDTGVTPGALMMTDCHEKASWEHVHGAQTEPRQTRTARSERKPCSNHAETFDTGQAHI